MGNVVCSFVLMPPGSMVFRVWIQYVSLLVSVCLMLYVLLFIEDVNVLVGVVWMHVLHLGVLQGWNPVAVLVLLVLACTSVSLRLLGRRWAVRGRLGMTFLHLMEECRTGRNVLRMFEMLGRPGWYVITNGILSAFVRVFCRLCMAVALSFPVAFVIADVIFFMGYPRALRCVVSCFSLFVRASSVKQIRLRRKARL